jgi:MoaA/NifB/PqqE/SkfB family radical SAM enzyme
MQPMHNIPARGGLNFDETPFLAIWEITQSCDLACKHCRAAAQPIAHPDELTNAEGKALIDQIAEMGVPIFVFTGGDPMKRKDVFELIRYAADKGVQVALTPSATPLLTREAIFKLKEAGLVRLGISLDGSTPEIHDTFRGLPGAWARTIQAIEWANEAGIPIQVHTTISRHNAHDLDNLCALFEKLAIVMWNVFFLVPVGRGQLGDLLSGEEFEQVFGKIYELSTGSASRSRPPRPCTTAATCCSTTWKSARWPRPRASGQPKHDPPPKMLLIRRPTSPARPPPTPNPHRKLGHPPRQRRQGLHVHLPRGQRLPQRIPAHPRRQHPRDAAGRDLPQRAHLQVPARHQQA